MLWELWHNIVEVSNTIIVVSLGRRLALDVVGDISIAEFGLSEIVLDLVNVGPSLFDLKTSYYITIIPAFRRVMPSKADTAPPKLWPVTTTL